MEFNPHKAFDSTAAAGITWLDLEHIEERYLLAACADGVSREEFLVADLRCWWSEVPDAVMQLLQSILYLPYAVHRVAGRLRCGTSNSRAGQRHCTPHASVSGAIFRLDDGLPETLCCFLCLV